MKSTRRLFNSPAMNYSTSYKGRVSPQAGIALSLIDAVNERDWEYCDSIFSQGFVHTILPPSLVRAPKNKTELINFFIFSTKYIPDFTVYVQEVVEGPGQVWVYANSTGLSPLLPDTPYRNTYVFMFDFVTEHRNQVQISRFKEYVDSGFSGNYTARLNAAVAALNTTSR